MTKLLGMIVYKNYFPQDFALLHRREGKIYSCISSKPKFIAFALKEIEAYEKELSEKEEKFKKDANLSKADLRRLFLFKLYDDSLIPHKLSLRISNQNHSLEELANNEDLFNSLLSGQGTYSFTNSYNRSLPQLAPYCEKVKKEINYYERLELIDQGKTYFHDEHKRIKQERINVKSLRLKDLIAKYKLGETEYFKKLGLSPMMNVFVRRGYLDEDYYDYISYFYEGMVSQSDRDLLLSMKIEECQPYDWHIDKIENFVKELKDYMFESDAILNIDLLDYVASHGIYSEMFEHVMMRLERDNAPLQFLSQYYSEGKRQEEIFKHFIEYENSWNNIINWKDDTEKGNLIEAYLKYCAQLGQEQQVWLNKNFKFLVEHREGITLEQSLKLASNSCFVNLCEGSDDLLDCVIEYKCYKISLENMFLITRHLQKGDKTISAENLNCTRIDSTNNEAFVNYVEENISTAIQCLKDENKDESSEVLLFLLTNEHISADAKVKYLTGQHNHIDSFEEIEDKGLYDIAVKAKIISPTWNNVSFYYDCKKGISEELIAFINHYATVLSEERYPDDSGNKENLYNSLFGSKILEIDNYKKLLRSFNCAFTDVNKLKKLGQDRLLILAENGRISCSAESFASLLVNISKNEVLNLGLVVYVIESGLKDYTVIAQLIDSMGGDYSEISDQDKSAKLPDSTPNRQLLETLKKVGFISSFKKETDKLQVYHKTKNI